MGAAIGTEHKINYCDLAIFSSVLGFTLDSWFWYLAFNLTLFIIPLIVNEWAYVFIQDNMEGYMFILAFILSQVIFLLKKNFEFHVLGRPYAYWNEMENFQKMGWKGKLKNGWVVLVMLLHYSLSISVLSLPVLLFYFTEFWAYNVWGYVAHIFYWTFVIGVIALYIPYNLMVVQRMIRSPSTIEKPVGGSWWSRMYVEGYKARYRIVVGINALTLFLIYCAYLPYIFERANIINWFNVSEYSKFALYLIGFGFVGFGIFLTYLVGTIMTKTLAKSPKRGELENRKPTVVEMNESLLKNRGQR